MQSDLLDELVPLAVLQASGDHERGVAGDGHPPQDPQVLVEVEARRDRRGVLRGRDDLAGGEQRDAKGHDGGEHAGVLRQQGREKSARVVDRT